MRALRIILLALAFNSLNVHAANDGRNLAVTAGSAKRVALVIGNDRYQHVDPLKNAVSDARAMAAALQKAGFTVTFKSNSDLSTMKQAVRLFKSNLSGGDEAVFFYAGHGVQLGNTNYLLPVDISGDSEDQVKDDAILLQRLLDDLQDQKVKFALAIVDACRDNPFKSFGRNIGGSRGLAPTSAANGQMIIFSAGSGQRALDNLGNKDHDKNGLFTRVFLQEMQKPGLEIHQVVRNVRNRVWQMAKNVNGDQVPSIYDQVIGDFYFFGSSTKVTSDTSINLNPREPIQIANSESKPSTSEQPIRPTIPIEHENIIPPIQTTGDPKAVEWRDQAIKSANSSDWTEAIRKASVAISLDPGLASAHVVRCWAYLEKNFLDEATSDCEAALSIEPNNIYALNNRGAIRKRQGRIEEALVDYERACKGTLDLACENFKQIQGYSPKDPSPFIQKQLSEADVKFTQKNWDAVIQITSKVLSIDPDKIDAYIYRSRAFKKKGIKQESANDIEEAIRRTTSIITLKPGLASPYVNRSWAYLEQGSLDEAISDCNTVLSIEPNNVNALNNRGVANERQGRIDIALTDYEQACVGSYQLACENFKLLRGYYPKDKNVYIQQQIDEAEAKFAQKNWKDVISITSKVISLAPEKFVAYIDRSAAYSNLGQLQQAFDDVDVAIKLNPDAGAAYNNRGYVNQLMKKPHQAILDYEIACNLNYELGCTNYKNMTGTTFEKKSSVQQFFQKLLQ